MIDGPHIPSSFAAVLRARADDEQLGYVLDDEHWTWSEVVGETAVRAAALDELLGSATPRHVGVLLDNTPEYLFWIGAAAFAGATVVGINPTRRGAELDRDIGHTDCQLVITDGAHAELLSPDAVARTLLVDSDDGAALLERHAGTELPDRDPADHTLLLLFTSGSTSAPKAVVCSSARLASSGANAAWHFGVTVDDICYCSMPLFHGNALMACWAPAAVHGATVVLRRRFSASAFLDDVRRHRVTYFTYVGRTIAYVLAQPPTEHDRDHRLRLGFGTEASAPDRERFLERFGCPLVEGYGSSESVVSINRTPDTPPAALGRPPPGTDVAVVDPATSLECPPAELDASGRLLNAGTAIGEIVSRSGSGAFEGYYNNAEATAERLRDGWYWTGDLAYRDADGFFYFAGRNADWIRVDSENFAAAPVEAILARLPVVVMVAVYPVPDARTGDQVMAALELAPGAAFDADGFGHWLAEQPDLGTKWAPRFVRQVGAMPLTSNNKVHKPPLRAEAWIADDPVWVRTTERADPGEAHRYARLGAAGVDALAASFAAHGRSHLLPQRPDERSRARDGRLVDPSQDIVVDL